MKIYQNTVHSCYANKKDNYMYKIVNYGKSGWW